MRQKLLCFAGKPIDSNIKEYQELGYKIIILSDKISKDNSDQVNYQTFTSDFSDYKSLEKYILENNIPKPDLIIATSEAYVLVKAWLLNIWDIPGISIEAAEASTDKILMREHFHHFEVKTDKHFSPQYAEINNAEELIKFAESNSFPLILKPANLYKSILITKADTLEELKNNYKSSLIQIKKQYLKRNVSQRKPRFIVEEFMIGKMCSMETFVDGNGECYFVPSIFDLVTAMDIGVNDNYHYLGSLPSNFSELETKELQEVAKLGIAALGLKYSAAHVELIYTSDGAKIIEIGARIGGMRHQVFQMAYGISLIQAELNVNQNIKPDLSHELIANVALCELYPDHEGKYAGIQNLEKLKELKSLYSLSIKMVIGEMVGLSKHGYKPVGVLTLINQDKKTFDEDCDYIEKNVSVIAD